MPNISNQLFKGLSSLSLTLIITPLAAHSQVIQNQAAQNQVPEINKKQCLEVSLGCTFLDRFLSANTTALEVTPNQDIEGYTSNLPDEISNALTDLDTSLTIVSKDIEHKVQSQNRLISQIIRPPGNTAGSPPRLRIEPQSEEDPIFRPRSDVLLQQGSSFSPSISVFNPTAFGQSLGDLSIGIGFQERTRFSTKSDGAVGLSFGLGDPVDLVGLDVSLSFTDLSDFFNRGIVGFQLHRQLPNSFAIAVGVDDALTWGKGDLDGPSPYGVISKVFYLNRDPQRFLSQIALSAGVGTGRYRTIPDINHGRSDPNPFATVAFRLFEPVNLISEWTGQDLTLGLSIQPIPKIPFILTPAVTDITGNAGDGWRFVLGAGYSFQF